MADCGGSVPLLRDDRECYPAAPKPETLEERIERQLRESTENIEKLNSAKKFMAANPDFLNAFEVITGYRTR